MKAASWTKLMSRALCASVTLVFATHLIGCSPDGAGTIKIENPQAIRAQAGGGPAPEKASDKQSKALKIEEEAGKKHPKLN